MSVDAAAAERFRSDVARLCDPDAGRVLLAVSGGGDSLALLLLAHAAMAGRVQVATVDHGLRPESASEAAFVVDVCRALGVPHAVLRAVRSELADRTGNLSARARLLRYRLLEEHRVASGCAWIATAHHADDQLETMAMRLNRGAGLTGLAGIRVVTGMVIRPLLTWRCVELAALVQTAGLVPVLDPSNVDDRFDRARLRKALAGVDYLDAARWGRSAAVLAEAEHALAWSVDRLAIERIKEVEDGVRVMFDDDPPEIVRRLVARSVLRVRPEAELRGGEVRRLAGRLRGVGASGVPLKATLAGVVVTATAEGRGVEARFSLAPPHRGTAS